MRRLNDVLIIFVVLLLALPCIATATEWQIQIVDSEGYVGEFNSLALDSNGCPHISYLDGNNGDLKYAYWDRAKWQIQTVDKPVDMGGPTSLALNSNGYPHISYCIYWMAADAYLKYAYWDGAEWQIQTVDTELPEGAVGDFNSLALDSSDYPHISYFDRDNGNLKYAYWDGTEWQIQTVDTEGDVGLYTSLALDSNDYPHISYFDNLRWRLKYAYWDEVEWQIQTVDTEMGVGEFTSLALDSSDYPHISYWGSDKGDLKYAYWDGAVWQIQTIDSEEDVGSHTFLALDSNDYPHISYYDDTNGDLKYAYWNGVKWQIQTVDSEGQVGRYTSLALDSNDYPHISYYDYINGDLKYAKFVMSDTTPPSAITDLATSNPTSDSITLTWTAPGDDGNVGTASEYDIRYSTSPIDEGNWDSATQVDGEPAPNPAGTNEFFTVTGLSTDTTYYFAMKTADEVPNWSELSNVTSVNLLLTQYEPILYLYGDGLGEEVYMPMNVAPFVAECSLWYSLTKKIHIPILPVGEVTLEALSGRGGNYYLKFVQDLDERNTPDHEKAKVRYENIADKKVTYYGRIKQDGDYTVLQYWFFDAFNYWGEVKDGMNNHEGDWEMIMIFLKGDKPEYVAYSSHHNKGAITRRRWSQIERKEEHPVVYVALGSHANYFNAGEVLVKNPIGDYYVDHTSNIGAHIGPGEEIEWHHGSNYILDDDNIPGWVDSYEGLWGVDYKPWDFKTSPLEEPPSTEIIFHHFPTDGPHGPGGSKWSNPVEWADIPGDVSITIESFSNLVPQGGTLEFEALVTNNSSTDFGLVRIGITIVGLIRNPNLKWFKLKPFETIPIASSVPMPIGATLGVYTAVVTCEDILPPLKFEGLTQEAFNFEIISPVADVGEVAYLAPPTPRTSALQNYPNPFNPDTWIPYGLAQDADVTISIYNAKGQLIRILNLGNQKAGIYVSKDKAAYWDGRDNAKEKVASGVYFYTLQVEYQSQQRRGKFHHDEKAGSFRMTRKMVILK